MKKEEIKKFSTDELKSKINLFKKDLFNLRFRKINGQLEDSSKVAELKKNVAKLLTRLNNKK
jgi:large subunit ribosomal protein L29